MPNEHFVSGIEGAANDALFHLYCNSYFPKKLEEAVLKYQIVKSDLCSKTTNGVDEFLG